MAQFYNAGALRILRMRVNISTHIFTLHVTTGCFPDRGIYESFYKAWWRCNVRFLLSCIATVNSELLHRCKLSWSSIRKTESSSNNNKLNNRLCKNTECHAIRNVCLATIIRKKSLQLKKKCLKVGSRNVGIVRRTLYKYTARPYRPV